MSHLFSESFVFDPRPEYPYLLTANRYYANAPDPDGITLVLAHGTGFHKEQWEPTLEYLFSEAGTGVRPLKIREAWSIDAPNHGDAAILNEKAFRENHEVYFSWSDYGRGVHALLSGLGTGVNVDFSCRKLVGIGHSMGAIALVLSHTFYPRVNWTSLVMVDPILPPLLPSHMKPTFAAGAATRRDIWPSRESALEALQGRKAFQIYDSRVLKIYAEYGMRDLPTAEYPDKHEGVTLKCTKKQEVACYSDSTSRWRAYEYLSKACTVFPVHIIFGAINDAVSREEQDELVKCRDFATVTRVEGAGHLVVQMQPERLAQAISGALGGYVSAKANTTNSKL